MSRLLDVVHEDEDFLLLNKPAGLVCHPTKGDEYSSLISRARLYFQGRGLGKPQLINRLDRETSGIVLMAKTASAAAAIRKRWERGEVTKGYLAIVEGSFTSEEELVDLPIGRDEASSVAIKGCVRPDGAPSVTRIQRISVFENAGRMYSALQVKPQTGRKHQIRIHLSHLGHPILGDKLYGHDERCYLDFVTGQLTQNQQERLGLANHALHAEILEWTDAGAKREYQAPLRVDMREFVGAGRSLICNRLSRIEL